MSGWFRKNWEIVLSFMFGGLAFLSLGFVDSAYKIGKSRELAQVSMVLVLIGLFFAVKSFKKESWIRMTLSFLSFAFLLYVLLGVFVSGMRD